MRVRRLAAADAARAQASYLLLVEHNGTEHGMGSSELLLYSAILSAPILGLLSLATGEAAQAVALAQAALATPADTYSLVWLLLASSFCGCLLNYSLFLCTVANSALTTTIVGVLKGVVATFLGFFLLGGVRFHWVNVVGVALNTAGGVWYTTLCFSRSAEDAGAYSLPPQRSHLSPLRRAGPSTII